MAARDEVWEALAQTAGQFGLTLPMRGGVVSRIERIGDMLRLGARWMRQVRWLIGLALVEAERIWPQYCTEVGQVIDFDDWVSQTLGLDVSYATYRAWMQAAREALLPNGKLRGWFGELGFDAAGVVEAINLDKVVRVLPHADNPDVLGRVAGVVIAEDTGVRDVIRAVKQAVCEQDDVWRGDGLAFDPMANAVVVMSAGDDGVMGREVVLVLGQPVSPLGREVIQEVIRLLETRYNMRRLGGGHER